MNELRRNDVRVMLVNPSEVLTSFASKVGWDQEASPKKLRGREIADAIVGALKIDNRGFHSGVLGIRDKPLSDFCPRPRVPTLVPTPHEKAPSRAAARKALAEWGKPCRRL